MEDELTRIQQRILRAFAEEAQKWLDALLRDTFNPEAFLRFVAGMGIDLSQMPGTVGKECGSNPYRVLGLEKTATDEEVKKRYREFLMKLHPDTAGIPGTDYLLQMILAAYGLIKRERGWQ